MMNSEKNRTTQTSAFLFLLLALSAASVAADLAWTARNGSIQGQDVANHLSFSVDFFYAFTENLLSAHASRWEKLAQTARLLWLPLHHKAVWHANFMYLPTTLLYRALGQTLFVAKLSNWIYLAVLSLALFFLGKRLAGALTGILAVCLLLLCPLLFQASRQYGADLPLAAMTTLCVLLLVKTEAFRNPYYGVLAGLATGLATLVKGQALVFVVGPWAALLCKAAFRDETGASPSRRARLANGLLSSLIAAAVASLWWGIHYQEAAQAMFRDLPRVYPPRYALGEGLLRYAELGLSSMGPLLLLLFLTCLAAFARSSAGMKGPLLSCIALPVYYFSFHCGAYQARYLMPLLPWAALLTAWGLLRLKSPRLRSLALLGTLAQLTAQFIFLTCFDPPRRGCPSWLLSCGTDYDDRRQEKNADRLDDVLAAIRTDETAAAPRAALLAAQRQRPLNVLLLSMLPGRPTEFEVKYRLRSMDRRFDAYDFAASPAYAEGMLDSTDFLVMRLPGMQDFDGWPPRHAVLSRLDRDPRSSLPGGPSNEERVRRLYAFRPDYALAAVIPAQKYRWAVYRNRKRMPRRMSGSTPE